jgi:hypothetical protein
MDTTKMRKCVPDRHHIALRHVAEPTKKCHFSMKLEQRQYVNLQELLLDYARDPVCVCVCVCVCV